MILWTYDIDPPSIIELLGDGVQEVTELLHNNSGGVSSPPPPPPLPHPHTLLHAPQHHLQAQNVPNASMTPSCSNTPQTPGISPNMHTEESHQLRGTFQHFFYNPHHQQSALWIYNTVSPA